MAGKENRKNRGNQANPAEEKDLTTLDFEYQAALESVGKDQVYGIAGAMWKVWNRFVPRAAAHTFHKKTYLLLLLFTGFLGGHRYYEGRRGLGILYTLFCWTGVPLAMCLIDAMIVIPVKADENGMVSIG